MFKIIADSRFGDKGLARRKGRVKNMTTSKESQEAGRLSCFPALGRSLRIYALVNFADLLNIVEINHVSQTLDLTITATCKVDLSTYINVAYVSSWSHCSWSQTHFSFKQTHPVGTTYTMKIRLIMSP